MGYTNMKRKGSKLTKYDLKTIRDSRLNSRTLAQEFGVSVHVINNIRKGKIR